jgi:hypothetical protein
MDQVTQQNAALVEEMAAAASSLNNQAQDLVSTVAFFKLSPGDEHPARAQAPRMGAAPAPASARLAPAVALGRSQSGEQGALAGKGTPSSKATSTAVARSVTPGVAPKPKAAPAADDADWEAF